MYGMYTMLDKPCDPGVEPTQKPRNQPAFDFTYWSVLGTFNEWNIIQFIKKTTSC